MCRCGHELWDHSDRAIWPPCEGSYEPNGYLKDRPWFLAGKSVKEACPCEGFDHE